MKTAQPSFSSELLGRESRAGRALTCRYLLLPRPVAENHH